MKPAPSQQEPTVTTDREKRECERLSLRDAFVGVVFRLLGQRLWDRLYTLFSESRSFLGRLRTQFAKDQVGVSLGPSLEQGHQGWTRNQRTLARSRGIEKLQATRSWLTPLDFETFLVGFDAGEQWAFDTMSNRPHPGQDSLCNTPDSPH